MYSFYILRCPKYDQMGSKVNVTGHIWAMTFDLLFYIFLNSKICKSIPFLKHLSDLINFSPFSLETSQLENLTPVQKVNDLLLF